MRAYLENLFFNEVDVLLQQRVGVLLPLGEGERVRVLLTSVTFWILELAWWKRSWLFLMSLISAELSGGTV